MKKLLCALTIVIGLATTGCRYDDSELWNAVGSANERIDALEQAAEHLNTEIDALNKIINALNNNVYVTEVKEHATGVTIMFSDGTSATIINGRDGLNAPVISVEKDENDGNLYWTLDGEWLQAGGERVRANGIDGNDGAYNGIAPQVRINPETKEWEISVDEGKTWESTGVNAEGKDGESGESLFESVDTSDPLRITFELRNGQQFTLPRYDETYPLFYVEGAEGVQIIRNGQSKTYGVTENNVSEYTIQKPDGWKVQYSGGQLTITAPAESNSYAEQEGSISIVSVSDTNRSSITKIEVSTYELRVLTFEDEDSKFSPYDINRGGGYRITKWSELIDEQEYGGPLLYDGYMGTEPYYWYDENNTELKHTFPESWGSYIFWGGGHAISNYASHDIEKTGSYVNQLTILGDAGSAGHNGSCNFAIHFGYTDESGWGLSSELPSLEFGDGVERVIDHMYVMPTNYELSSFVEGNGLTAKIQPGDCVRIVATGYSVSGAKGKSVEFTLCNGPEEIVTEWSRFDLSGLGKVAKVEFNICGTSDNGYGFSQPAYFAYDDVAVRF